MLPDLNTTELRRLATEQARKSRRQLQAALFVVHGFLYIAAIVVLAAMVAGMPLVANALWSSIDLSLIIGGVFIGWGVGVGLHGGALLIDSDWMERRLRQQAVSSVLSRSLLDEDDGPEGWAKAKRNLSADTDFSLNDDGELELLEREPSTHARNS